MDTEMGGLSALRHVENEAPGDKNKTLGRKRNVQGAKQRLLATKRKKTKIINAMLHLVPRL